MQSRALMHLCGVVAALMVTGAQAQSRLDEPRVHLTLPAVIDACIVMATVNNIGRSADLPVGIEASPEAFEMCPREPSGQFPLRPGPPMTPRAALDYVVAQAPDYAWREMNGVIVWRPVAAWRDGSHLLQTRVGGFAATDRDMTEALGVISKPLEPYEFSARLAQWAMSTNPTRSGFSLSLPGGTLLDALNAIVGARGDLGWNLTYCDVTAQSKTASVNLSIANEHKKSVSLFFAETPKGAWPCSGRTYKR